MNPYVENCFALDANVLTKRGLFKLESRPDVLRIKAVDRTKRLELRFIVSGGGGFIKVFEGDRWVQDLKVVHKLDSQGRRRWKFKEGATTFQKLYYTGEYFASRSALGLRYRDEGKAPLQRRLDKAFAAMCAFDREFPPGDRSDAAVLESCRLESNYYALFDQGALSVLAQTGRTAASEKARRARLEALNEQARSTIRVKEETEEEPSAARIQNELDKARADVTTKAKKAKIDRRSDYGLRLGDKPHLHLPSLSRLGLLTPSKVHRARLVWPLEWLPNGDQTIDLVIDLRTPGDGWLLLFLSARAATQTQAFRLVEIIGAFNRPELRIQSPISGRASKALIYSAGRFYISGAEPARKQNMRSLIEGMPAFDTAEFSLFTATMDTQNET